ncbi:hypothetical protein DL96DRAFT_1620717 [Flagelloscypha sp. PMI_526]|nr:hypothetical protein DL96DRAFT_1620717 [Flagelloscypha sp. PMI_526]
MASTSSQKREFSKDQEEDSGDSDSDSLENLPLFAAAISQNSSLIYEVVSHGKVPSYLNATYSLPSGQVIYRTETPNEWVSANHTIIQRIKPGSGPVDEFETIATIKYKAIGTSTFEFHDEKVSSSTLISKESVFTPSTWSWSGRDRLLTLPDGTRARWSLGVRICTLVSADDNKTPLAIFRRKRTFSDRPPRPACLEIFPAAAFMEFILMTGLYVEKIRGTREKALLLLFLA